MKRYLQCLAARVLPLAVAPLLLVAQPAAPEVSVSSRFDPALIHAGDPTYYVLEVQNSKGQIGGDFPQISGVRITGAQQNRSSTNINNGVVRTLRSILIPMTADAVGEYSVPAFDIQVDGQPLTVPPARLQVLAAQAGTTDAATEAADAPLRMTLGVPDGPYYVGQAIPVRLTLNANPQVSISGSSMPTKTGSDNYMLTSFSEVSARRAQVGGQIVNQHVIATVVTPLSSGEMVLGFEQTLVAHIPQSLRAGASRPSQSDDPFTRIFGRDDFFERMMNRQEVQLRTPPLTLQVGSLPAQGRPKDFSGAIGQFRLGAAVLSANEAEVGEPITLSFAVQGAGNFDRIQAPALQDSAQWRSYTPQAQFQPHNALGLQGEKTFEYTLIARSADVEQTPALQFSYFDPQQKAYIELTVPSLPIRITPSTDTSAPAANASTAQRPQASAADGDLLPLMAAPSSTVATAAATGSGTSRLLLNRTGFYAIQIVPALALAGLVLYRRRQLRLQSDPLFARGISARRQVAIALRQAHAAAAAADAAGFYAAAETALKQSLTATEPQVASASLTAADIEQRLAARTIAAEPAAQVRRFFSEADALRYGGASAATPPLQTRAQELETLLRQLSAKERSRTAGTKNATDSRTTPNI